MSTQRHHLQNNVFTQLTFTCLKLTIETLEQGLYC